MGPHECAALSGQRPLHAGAQSAHKMLRSRALHATSAHRRPVQVVDRIVKATNLQRSCYEWCSQSGLLTDVVSRFHVRRHRSVSRVTLEAVENYRGGEWCAGLEPCANMSVMPNIDDVARQWSPMLRPGERLEYGFNAYTRIRPMLVP